MFVLKKWRLDLYEKELVMGNGEGGGISIWIRPAQGGGKKAVVARGTCYGNPRFPEGRRVRTSKIVKADIREGAEQLILTTYSGSQYGLDFGEMDGEAYESTRESAKCLGIEPDVERCLWLWRQKQGSERD